MKAIEETLRNPATRTADVGGTASTEQVTTAVLDLLAAS
jgi:isocitrate/isopropylmalate dehydrogenase